MISNDNILDVVKDFMEFHEYHNNLDDIDKLWNNIPVISNEYLTTKEVTNEGNCPYCNEYVGLTEDITPLPDYIGKRNIDIYTTRFFRKCKYCNNVFNEDLGEKPDYDY